MEVNRAEFDVEATVANGEIPTQGDWIMVGDTRHLVTRSNVVNGSKVEMRLEPERETQVYDDVSDPSAEWDGLPDEFVEAVEE